MLAARAVQHSTWMMAMLVLTGASAGILLQQTLVTNPASGTPPALLETGSDGVTVLGTSATSATTELASTPIVGTFTGDVLEIAAGTVDLNVQVELIAETATTGESMLLEVDDGITKQLQVDVSGGTVLQSVGTPLQLDAGGSPMLITVSGTESLLTADTVYTMQIILTPATGAGSEARYDYVLTVT